jgi:hypothetical protein
LKEIPLPAENVTDGAAVKPSAEQETSQKEIDDLWDRVMLDPRASAENPGVLDAIARIENPEAREALQRMLALLSNL